MRNTAVKKRIEQLIAEAEPWQAAFHSNISLQKVWLTAAQNAVELLCTLSSSPYRVYAQSIF
jgi:hypothetical protein